jgi:DNA-binding transcriptional regulator YdaS (Cro superfamily)
LRRAAEIVGGEQRLALRLGVTPSHLALWISSAANTPDAVFLLAVDIVLEYELTLLALKPSA